MHTRIYSSLSKALVLFVMLLLPAALNAAEILFDQGHGQRFVIEEKGDLHLSGLAELLAADGHVIKSTKEMLTDQTLAGTDILVISGAFTPLRDGEIDSVLRFVRNGGHLAVMLHIGFPLSALLHPLEVDFTNYVLSEQVNVIGNEPKNFQVKDLETHPATAEIDHFSLYGAWALMNTADNARIIARTSPRAWLDLDGDRKLSEKDVVQAFGVAVAGSFGQGSFVVIGDDAVFQNRFLDENNRKFAQNIARWLK